MRSKKLKIWTLIALGIAVTVALYVIFINPPHKKSIMIDRTVGWTEGVEFESNVLLRFKEFGDPFYGSFLFENSRIRDIEPIFLNVSDDPAVSMETALRAAFEDDYIDIGSETPCVICDDNRQPSVMFLIGGETCVIAEMQYGRVYQCIDTRIQKAFGGTTSEQLRLLTVQFSVDLAALTRNEVEQLAQCVTTLSDKYIPADFAEDEDCPLSAERAFEVSSDILTNSIAGGQWSYLGDGEYLVYDAPLSDCWVLIGRQFALMLDKQTGEKVFLNIHAVD